LPRGKIKNIPLYERCFRVIAQHCPLVTYTEEERSEGFKEMKKKDERR